jgi:hypothetical protein
VVSRRSPVFPSEAPRRDRDRFEDRQVASGGVNITKIGRFENHYVFLSKPMVDDRALQSDERDARVIMPRWDFATFMQMQPNGRACAQ